MSGVVLGCLGVYGDGADVVHDVGVVVVMMVVVVELSMMFWRGL